MRLVLFLCVFLLVPIKSHAAVFISEVAWMGSLESANHEWIELYNDGAAVDVSGWTLSDGMNLSITIGEAKSIPANSYAVLERSSDSSAAGPAFAIYTGAMVNTGATLKLFRSDGSLVDQVAGGEDWKNIGGDNTTKETAQYSTQGWKTAVATPGYATEIVVASPPSNQTVPTTTTPKTNSPTQPVTKERSNGGNGNEATILSLPGVTLKLDISAAAFGYVNQPLKFFVEPAGIGATLINSLSYQWNFGDGLTSSAKDAEHFFSYPGTYLVTVFAGFKRQEQIARHEITILPVNISLTKNKLGDIQINNDSPYEINISGYKLKGNKDFIFPEHSFLLPTQTITIKRSKLGVVEPKMIALYDTESTIVAAILPASLTNNHVASSHTETQPNPQQILAASTQPLLSNNTNFNFSEENTSEEEILVPPSAPEALASANTALPKNNNRFIYLALVSTIGLAVLGVYLTAHKEN